MGSEFQCQQSNTVLFVLFSDLDYVVEQLFLILKNIDALFRDCSTIQGKFAAVGKTGGEDRSDISHLFSRFVHFH